ncbi:MAG: hypothetical protein HY738_11270 [Bacteroidia bacterium]|nr:hypothetical protein [Bacteroidia bacterium]
MKKITIIFAFAIYTGLFSPLFWKGAGGRVFAQSREVPFTLDDRDRIIQTQAEVSSLRNDMNTRFEAFDTKFEARFEAIDDRFEAIDDKLNKLYTLIYFILGGVFGLIGLIFWDRRSYVKPVKEDLKELMNVLRDFAKTQPELADILRSHKLL